MNITDRQNQFLNIFPSKYREHIVEFSKMVECSDVDVLILTARKAACFFHCLEHLRIWQPGSKIIVSERCRDHDLSWISGKSVAIVDEVIATGTNLSNLINIVRASGARSVQVLALFINKEWFVDDFLNGIQPKGYIPLPSAEAQALGTTIVDAMHIVPRPYAVDYPIFSWDTLSEYQFLRLFDSTEWQIKQTYSNTVPGANRTAVKVEYFSLIPKFSNDYFFDVLDIPKQGAIVKVRLYGRWEFASEQKEAAYRFRMVPYFILPPLTSESLSGLFGRILQPLSSTDRQIINNSCINDKSRLRITQYILAAWVGALWIQHQHRMGLNLTFSHDAREIHYIFPHSIHAAIQALSAYSAFGLIDKKYTIPYYKSIDFSTTTTEVNTFAPLLQPFESMYKEKEIRLREQAKRHKAQLLTNPRFRSLLNRLNEGVSLPELSSLLSLPAHSAQEVVSEFLDVAIDHGYVVPISVVEPSSNGGSTIVYRAFRHGEETYLLLKDKEVFWLMVSSFYESIRKTMSSNTSIPVSPLFKIGAAPKVYIEKILVLFLRYGLQEGIFTQAFSGDCAANGEIRVRVASDLHGSRLAIGKALPTEMSQDSAFVNWLLDNDILRKHRSGGYILGDYKSIADGPDQIRRGKSKQFGILMSNVIISLLTQESESHVSAPAERVNNTLVALSTCETASSTIIAIGAELRRVWREFSSFPLDVSIAPHLVLPAIEKERGAFANARTAANSAYYKAKLYLSRESENSIKLIDELLLQTAPMAASVWETASAAFRRVWGRGAVREENQLIVNLLSTILPLQFGVHFFEYLILRACTETLSDRSKKRLTKLPRNIDTMIENATTFSTQLSQKEPQLYKAASQSLVKSLDLISRQWYQIKQIEPQQSIADIRIQLVKLLRGAEAEYMKIDVLYNHRGQIARSKSYESSLFVNFYSESAEIGFRTILQRAVERSDHGGPRAYTKPAVTSQQRAGLTFRDCSNIENLRYEIFATGPGAAAWLGYLAAEALRATPSDSRYPTMGAILRLEGSYSAIVGAHDGELHVPQSLLGAWEEQAKILISTQTALVAQEEKSATSSALNYFESMFDTVLKYDWPRNRLTCLMKSEALGGVMSTTSYLLSKNQAIPQAAFIFTVQDEMSSFLSYLKDQDINVWNQAPSATMNMAWYANIAGSDPEFQIVTVLNREMGSHDAAALIAEVGRVYNPAVMFLVGIAASLTGDKKDLGNVVVPNRVLDAHQTVSAPEAEKNRSFGRPFPPRERDFINGFIVENTIKGMLSVSKYGQMDKMVRSTYIESDAALLRNDSPNERHRLAASSHSDKIDSYEMETAGVVAYLENTPTAPPTFVVKGISDLGGTKKRDDDNRYLAARNAVIVALTMAEYVLKVNGNSV